MKRNGPLARKVRRQRQRRSYEALRDVSAVRIKLENGTVETFDLATELHVPSDPEGIHREAANSSGQLAFWGYQAERALRVVRNAEVELANQEGWTAAAHRKLRDDEAESYTERLIQGCVDQDPKIRKLRVALASKREQYGTLFAVKEAIRERSATLRGLLRHYEP